MTTITYAAMPTHEARNFQAGAADAYGRKPERHVSDGKGVPCRHCLRDVAEGEPYLMLAYRPFPELQPYAETGPVFLHAGPCERAAAQSETPAMLLKRASHFIKGYGPDDRIVYGTGKIVTSPELSSSAAAILDHANVAYVHVRSSVNNCYTCRIDRV